MRMPRLARRGDESAEPIEATLDSATATLAASEGDMSLPHPPPGDQGSLSINAVLSGVSTIPTFTAPALHSSMVPSVRFPISNRGYHFPQVEEFVKQVAEAMAVLEQGVNDAHKALHTMDGDLAQVLYDNQRLRAQMEVFRVQGDPLVHSDGSYVRESDVAAAEELEQARSALTQAQSEIARLTADNTHLQAMGTSLQDEINSLREWGAQAGAELAAHRQETLALQAEAQSLRDYIAQQSQATSPEVPATYTQADVAAETPTSSPSAAQEQVAPAAHLAPMGAGAALVAAAMEDHSPVDEPQAQSQAQPQVVAEYMDESATAQFAAQIAAETRAGTGTVVPVTVLGVESELPDGVEPPGTGEYTYPEYPQAAPGVPLSNGDVPLETWAPEVSVAP